AQGPAGAGVGTVEDGGVDLSAGELGQRERERVELGAGRYLERPRARVRLAGDHVHARVVVGEEQVLRRALGRGDERADAHRAVAQVRQDVARRPAQLDAVLGTVDEEPRVD